MSHTSLCPIMLPINARGVMNYSVTPRTCLHTVETRISRNDRPNSFIKIRHRAQIIVCLYMIKVSFRHDILYNCYKTRTDKLSNMISFITVTKLQQTNSNTIQKQTFVYCSSKLINSGNVRVVLNAMILVNLTV